MTMRDFKGKDKKALIMAGGTGGHIFPALAVAKELQSMDWKVHWLGSRNGMEEIIIGNTDIPLNLIDIVGLRGNGIRGWLKAPILLLKAILNAMKVVKQLKPNVVIGFGGFASGPGGIAAFLLGIKLFIHEQNAVAGMTNRYLSRIAKWVYLGFPKAFGHKVSGKYKVVGNPVRKEIKNIQKEPVLETKNKINLLILGGSRGAKAINQLLPPIIKELLDEQSIQVVHQAGKGNKNETLSAYENCLGRYEVVEFIDEIQKKLAWADVVICRAGASTVAEIAAVGIAAIFIPFPYAVDDHQYVNGMWLAERKAAEILRENELSSAAAKEKIITLLSSIKKINQLANNAKTMAYFNASNEIVNDCEALVKNQLRAA